MRGGAPCDGLCSERLLYKDLGLSGLLGRMLKRCDISVAEEGVVRIWMFILGMPH